MEESVCFFFCSAGRRNLFFFFSVSGMVESVNFFFLVQPVGINVYKIYLSLLFYLLLLIIIYSSFLLHSSPDEGVEYRPRNALYF